MIISGHDAGGSQRFWYRAFHDPSSYSNASARSVTVTDENTPDTHIHSSGSAKLGLPLWPGLNEGRNALFQLTEGMELFRYPNVMKALT